MNVNAKYKNSVFSLLFSNPEAIRELYGAIEGVVLPPETSIDINTLSDVLYMGQINDLSFTVDNRLVVLIEHQSTINPNMPLRLLMYIAHIYEKIIDRNKLYKTKLEKIPAPEFIVLYNPGVAAKKFLKQTANMPSAKGNCRTRTAARSGFPTLSRRFAAYWGQEAPLKIRNEE